LIKSAVLLGYCPSAAATLYNALINDQWSTHRIRSLGILYAIPDTVSLLLVSRMATSTKIHHLCVIAFMICNLFIEYEHESVGRALVVYAIFSTFACTLPQAISVTNALSSFECARLLMRSRLG